MPIKALRSEEGRWLEVTSVATEHQEVYWTKWASESKPDDEFARPLGGSTKTSKLLEHMSGPIDPNLSILENQIQAGYKAILEMPGLFDGWTAVNQ
jgi:hypothetical protein